MVNIEAQSREDTRGVYKRGVYLFLIGLAGISLLILFQAYRSAQLSLSRIKALSDNIVENMPIGLVVLDTDLIFMDSAGDTLLIQPPGPPMWFLGPRRFINTINGSITLIDESSYPYDTLVQFETLDGAGWDTYGQTGDLEGEFNFFMGVF